MSSAFPGTKPFPGDDQARHRIGGNRPPLDEEIVDEFMAGLRSEPGLLDRVEELCSRADAVQPCKNKEDAGRLGDFVKIARRVCTFIEDERVRRNRPLLGAQEALNAKANSYLDRLTAARAKVQKEIDAYAKRLNERRAEQERKAREAARLAEQEAAAQPESKSEPISQPEPTPVEEGMLFAAPPASPPAPALAPPAPRESQPIARGDLGSRVGLKKVWRHEITNLRALPDNVLQHPKAVAALNQVVGGLVRAGQHNIPGVRVWDENETTVR